MLCEHRFYLGHTDVNLEIVVWGTVQHRVRIVVLRVKVQVYLAVVAEFLWVNLYEVLTLSRLNLRCGLLLPILGAIEVKVFLVDIVHLADTSVIR